MGNRIVTISGGSAASRSIEDGDMIRSRSPVGIDEAIESIMTTAEETNLLFDELTAIIRSIREGEGLLGVVISDSTVKDQFRELLANVNRSSDEALTIVQSLKRTTRTLNEGEGLATRILYDTAMADKTIQIMDTAEYVAANLAIASKELSVFSKKLNNRRGMIDKLLTDTLMAREVEMTIRNIREGSESIEGAVNTIENSWLLNLFSGNDDEKKKAESKQAQKKKKGTKELARENKP